MADDKKPPASATDMQKAIAEAVAAALKEAIPMTVAMMQQANKAAADAAKPHVPSRIECQDCGQMESACKGEHAEAVVFPRNPRHSQFFEGIIINGRRYMSSHSGHRITVPKFADIAALLSTYELNEEEMANGRVVQNHSAAINGATGGFATNPNINFAR